jgi:hypothetical protein
MAVMGATLLSSSGAAVTAEALTLLWWRMRAAPKTEAAIALVGKTYFLMLATSLLVDAGMWLLRERQVDG